MELNYPKYIKGQPISNLSDVLILIFIPSHLKDCKFLEAMIWFVQNEILNH